MIWPVEIPNISKKSFTFHDMNEVPLSKYVTTDMLKAANTGLTHWITIRDVIHLFSQHQQVKVDGKKVFKLNSEFC